MIIYGNGMKYMRMMSPMLGGNRLLNLNFKGAIPISVTPSGGANGTRVNNSGVIIAASAGRLDYSPVTLVSRGLLIEEQRTNIFKYSEALDNAYWDTKSNLSITANAILSPDGTSNADKLVEAAVTSEHTLARGNVPTLNATVYTMSVFAKAGERSILRVGDIYGFNNLSFFVNLSTGIVSSRTGGTTPVVSTVNVGNGWWRIIISDISTATEVDPSWSTIKTGTTTSYVGDGTSGLYLWGAQLEVGTTATTYVPTSSATVTRTADQIALTIPTGVSTIRCIFDDATTRDIAVSPGALSLTSTDLIATRLLSIVSL